MKFGGTSVEDATAIDRIAGIVKGRLAQHPYVVVSAMSKVTDTLLAMAAAAGKGDRDKALDLCRQVRERHFNTAGELLGTGLYTELHSELQGEFDSLEQLLRGICAVGELTPRTSDYVVSFGERLSSVVITAAFLAREIPATLVDARQVIITDGQHGRAIPQVDEINHRLQLHAQPLVADGQVPVMGGFIGSTREGITTTIGRGGSDFSAALVGAGLNAERIEIWTDVDGMKTTDPRICPDAHRIKVISFDEAAELAYFRGEGAASGHGVARGGEEYSGPGVEFAQSGERGHANRGPHAEVEVAVQGDRCETAHYDYRNRGGPHADGAWLPRGRVRDFRAPSLRH